jgi:hypothetical protein
MLILPPLPLLHAIRPSQWKKCLTTAWPTVALLWDMDYAALLSCRRFECTVLVSMRFGNLPWKFGGSNARSYRMGSGIVSSVLLWAECVRRYAWKRLDLPGRRTSPWPFMHSSPCRPSSTWGEALLCAHNCRERAVDWRRVGGVELWQDSISARSLGGGRARGEWSCISEAFVRFARFESLCAR